MQMTAPLMFVGWNLHCSLGHAELSSVQNDSNQSIERTRKKGISSLQYWNTSRNECWFRIFGSEWQTEYLVCEIIRTLKILGRMVCIQKFLNLSQTIWELIQNYALDFLIFNMSHSEWLIPCHRWQDTDSSLIRLIVVYFHQSTPKRVSKCKSKHIHSMHWRSSYLIAFTVIFRCPQSFCISKVIDLRLVHIVDSTMILLLINILS